jgi:hypothetical protein
MVFKVACARLELIFRQRRNDVANVGDKSIGRGRGRGWEVAYGCEDNEESHHPRNHRA